LEPRFEVFLEPANSGTPKSLKSKACLKVFTNKDDAIQPTQPSLSRKVLTEYSMVTSAGLSVRVNHGPHSNPMRQSKVLVGQRLQHLLKILDDTSRNTYTCIVESALKAVRWVSSSRRDLKAFPRPVQRDVGQALYAAQCGEEYPSVKALSGFGGRTVLEIIAPYERDTFRAVYTVRFGDAIYVLYAFQKKSKKGIATPQKEIELVKQRLAAAERNYREGHN
jgi:phage-related protein